jgi:hypothetical protein
MIDIQKMIDDLENETERMNGWESQFFTDITDQWQRTTSLTPAQQDKLQQIYERYA